MDVKRLLPPRRVVMFEPGGSNVYKLRGTPGGQKPYCQARRSQVLRAAEDAGDSRAVRPRSGMSTWADRGVGAQGDQEMAGWRPLST
jgi:hypothetical protein